jgi:hypothetical protein
MKVVDNLVSCLPPAAYKFFQMSVALTHFSSVQVQDYCKDDRRAMRTTQTLRSSLPTISSKQL